MNVVSSIPWYACTTACIPKAVASWAGGLEPLTQQTYVQRKDDDGGHHHVESESTDTPDDPDAPYQNGIFQDNLVSS